MFLVRVAFAVNQVGEYLGVGVRLAGVLKKKTKNNECPSMCSPCQQSNAEDSWAIGVKSPIALRYR